MQLSWAVLFVLAQQCAPLVHWETLSALVAVESQSHPWAIHDNTTKERYFPKSAGAASALAEALIRKGHSVDLGLAQINSKNLDSLGLTVPQTFSLCRNLMAAQTLLNGNFQRALKAGYPYGQPALQAALSAYNTGSFTRGRDYVSKVLYAAKSPFPVESFLVHGGGPGSL